MYCARIYVSSCLVSAPPRIPAPHRTHPNPFTPISTHMYPSLPQIHSFLSSCLFLVLTVHAKTCPDRAFGHSFALFLFSPVRIPPIAPICIHPHPSAPIFDHFWQNPKNIMSGEISPVMADLLGPKCPILVLFLCPPVPPAPQNIHPHPSSPILTHLHLFSPVCTLNYNLYV